MKTKDHTKATCGPGGLKCPCCRRYHLAQAKKINSRAIRRRVRQELHVELKAA